jgi:putative ABC transport system ATP-binding protein
MIEIKNLSKVYRMGELEVPALRNVSENIERGEMVAIMGPSGSGKSTLMNILGLPDRPTGGVYRLEGMDTSTFSDDRLSEIRNTVREKPSYW